MTVFSSKIIFLGTGTGVPSLERASPAVLLKLPANTILVDMGSGTLRQLARISVSVFEINYILLTHLHPDHSAELGPFLFAGNYSPYMGNRRPCSLFAGRDIESFFLHLKALYGRWIEWPPGLFQVSPLSQDIPQEKVLPDFILRSSPMEHTSSSLGYRITLPDGKSLVFSGDSDYSPSLVELAREADLLVCECSFPEEEKVSGHLIPSLAGRIAAEAGVKQLILTHFYPECKGRDLITPCARQYSGPISLAEDFQVVSL